MKGDDRQRNRIDRRHIAWSVPLVIVADVDLPGNPVRFDYQDLDVAKGRCGRGEEGRRERTRVSDSATLPPSGASQEEDVS